MGQKISDIFFQYRDFKSRYPGFFSKSGFCPCQFGTGFLVPGYRKTKKCVPLSPLYYYSAPTCPPGNGASRLAIVVAPDDTPLACLTPTYFFIPVHTSAPLSHHNIVFISLSPPPPISIPASGNSSFLFCHHNDDV